MRHSLALVQMRLPAPEVWSNTLETAQTVKMKPKMEPCPSKPRINFSSRCGEGQGRVCSRVQEGELKHAVTGLFWAKVVNLEKDGKLRPVLFVGFRVQALGSRASCSPLGGSGVEGLPRWAVDSADPAGRRGKTRASPRLRSCIGFRV